MTKKLLLYYVTAIAFVTLAGCSTTVPVTQKFPDAPAELMEKCPALDTIQGDQVLFSEFLKTVTNNYTKYHNCAKMIEAWQTWYIEQKKISDELNKK